MIPFPLTYVPSSIYHTLYSFFVVTYPANLRIDDVAWIVNVTSLHFPTLYIVCSALLFGYFTDVCLIECTLSFELPIRPSRGKPPIEFGA